MEIALHLEIILVIVAFIAGAVDAIAGGGGLIVVPILFLTGMSPVQVLGTSKLQALFGSGSATWRYAQKGLVDLKTLWIPAVICFITSLIGALLISFLPEAFVKALLPVILIAVALYFMFAPNLSDDDKTARMTPMAYGVIIAPLIAFYDGIFGPGAGTFYMLGWVLIAGYGLTRATAHTKLLNFASNLGAFAFFATQGVIFWKLGLMMGAAQFLGARVGASIAVNNGARLIKILLVITSLALAAKLLWDQFGT